MASEQPEGPDGAETRGLQVPGECAATEAGDGHAGTDTAGFKKASVSEAPIEAKLIRVADARKALQGPRRLHPSSILFGVLATVRQFAVAAILAVFLASSGNRAALVAAGLALVLTAATAVFRYFTLRYRLSEGELRINEGLIFRRHRTIPMARIQNIDLVQNPIHRWFHVAEVSIETAGGSEPEAKLRVLGLEDVALLRAAIFGEEEADSEVNAVGGTDRSAGMQGGDDLTSVESGAGAIVSAASKGPSGRGGSRRGATPGHLVHATTAAQLLHAGLISNRGLLVIPVALGLGSQLDLERYILDFAKVSRYLPQDYTWQEATLWGAVAFAVLLVLFKLLSVGWYFWRFFGHRVERHGDDLRVSCGLFTRVSATVPRRRIQFISVQQTWLSRWVGLAVIRLETAGGAGASAEDAKQSVARRWFMPVIAQHEVARVLAELRPGLEFEPDQLVWRATSPATARRLTRLAVLRAIALGGAGCLHSWQLGLAVGTAALIWFVYFARRYAKSLKFATTEHWVVFRSGILTRKISLTFYDKIQSVATLQSPFDRRWKMSTLQIDTAAAGPAQHQIAVKYLPREVAEQEADRVAWQASRHQIDQQNI